MLKTQNIFSTKFKNTSSILKFKKSFTKKIAAVIFLTAFAMVTWDLSVINTGAIKMDNIATYKINHYNSLIDYSNFKKEINNFVYTDNDFNKDLTTFKYLYEHKDNPIYEQMVNYNSNNYASKFASIMVFQNKYTDVNQKYQNLLNQSKNMKFNNGEDINSYSYIFSSDKPLKNDTIKFNKYISSSLRLGNNYTNYGKGLSANSKIYENMQLLLEENGYNKNILFLPPSFLKSKDSQYKKDKGNEYKRIIEEYKQNSDQYMLSLYKNGDMAKLKKLFKISKAFNYILVEKIIDDNKNNIDYAIPITSIIGNEIGYRSFDLYEEMVLLQKIKGQGNSEKFDYYENSLSLYY